MQIREHRKGEYYCITAGDDDFQAGTITVYDDDCFLGIREDKKLNGWKINWSAVGSVDIETAKMFRDALDKAIRIAESKGKV